MDTMHAKRQPLAIRYTHTDERTFTLTYEPFHDGWTVEVVDHNDPMGGAVYFDDWRCNAERSDVDWSDAFELDPTRSFGRILAHYLQVPEVPGPWHSITVGEVTVTMGGVR